LPVGAEPVAGGVDFRVWAPRADTVTVVTEGGAETPLPAEGAGWFGGLVEGVGPGDRYRFRLDGRGPFPDPASRFQPEGPHGPSEVVDPAFAWQDLDWGGVGLGGQVLYELHVGTFTPDGTYAAAAALMPWLAGIGIGVVELMPVAEFPGRFGWGYDGVDLFAPSHLYGRPDDLRRLVDAAHACGLGVILDVVYNHLGPDGNYLRAFAADWFTDRYRTEWGEAVDFDGPASGPVRAFFLANARYWIEEFHFDGLRLDATQCIYDASPTHIVAEIVSAVRNAAGGRATLVVAENEPQHAELARDWGVDALWNDDFHHSAMVAATGRNEAYYSDHLGRPQELVSAARHGTLFQGQAYAWQGKRRGSPALDLPGKAFVAYLQNHDQVANSADGRRLHRLTSPGRWRALTALLLLMPATPMLFQGQEFAASAPFLYFADHHPELAPKVARGRGEFLAQFPSVADPAVRRRLAPPEHHDSFAACVLDPLERERHAEAVTLHRDLIALRRHDPVFAAQGAQGFDGAVLGDEAFLLRWFGAEPGCDRLLLVNLGRDLDLVHAPEPLLAPPRGRAWHLAWSSEHPRYGGGGTPVPEGPRGWHLPGHAALVMTAEG
jgi:maltooligosyltrehalose trehalohydrolase